MQIQLIEGIAKEFPGYFVHSFGQDGFGRFDIAVYESEADFDADVEDGGNDRIVQRYSIEKKG